MCSDVSYILIVDKFKDLCILCRSIYEGYIFDTVGVFGTDLQVFLDGRYRINPYLIE
jgi:hypothetical protein